MKFRVTPATEEFLYFMLWSAEGLARPGWRTFNDSFESWAYRSGLNRRLAELERLKVLERSPAQEPGADRVYRMTELGRRTALSGVDPVARWSRPWDGQWRLVFFDVPEAQQRRRAQLRRVLREARFGYLQGSVWLSPDPLTELSQRLGDAAINVESLTLFEGRPCGGESDEALVRGAWDFGEVVRRYSAWEQVLAKAPECTADRERNEKGIRAWGKAERAAWGRVVESDPFLPKALWPSSYPGEEAWKRRREILTDYGRTLSKT